MRVTIEEVEEQMKDCSVQTVTMFDKPVTVTQVRMTNGFLLTETATCVDPVNYCEKVGKTVCLNRIRNKVWLLLGYSKQTKLSQAQQN